MLTQSNIHGLSSNSSSCQNSGMIFFLLKPDSYRRRLSGELQLRILMEFHFEGTFLAELSFWDLMCFYGRFRRGLWGKYISFLAACSYLPFPLGMFRRTVLQVIEVRGDSEMAHLLKNRLRERYKPPFRMQAVLSPGWKYGGLLHCPDREEYEFQIQFLSGRRHEHDSPQQLG